MELMICQRPFLRSHNHLNIPFTNHLALAMVRLEQYAHVLRYATHAMNLDNVRLFMKVRSLLVRSKAFTGLGMDDRALETSFEAQMLAPEDEDVKKGIKDLCDKYGLAYPQSA